MASRTRPARPSIPITVIGGYLGAGKTTLLNRLLSDPGGRRLGVIVNDFGFIGIDAALLAAVTDNGVISLPNGCVCCTLGGDLFETLTMLRDSPVPPDQIVIEASGVADPAVAAAWGTSAGFEQGGVIVLAAADSIRRQLVDKYVGNEVRRQLAGADVVVLTKTDLCAVGQAEAALETVRDIAHAEVIDGACVPTDVVLGLRPTEPSHAQTAAHDEQYVRWSWSGGVISAAKLDALMHDLPAGLLRLKGWVEAEGGQQLVQVVGRSVSITPDVDAEPGTRLEAIGIRAQLDPDALTTTFTTAFTTTSAQ